MFKGILIVVIRLYQRVLSPLFPASCRFYPSCSRYALECLQKFSFLTSIWYICRRLCCCHPWHSGGNDPVLEK